MNGGRAAAVVYSLIESCKVAGVDPQDYPTDALQRIGGSSDDEIHDLIPALRCLTTAIDRSKRSLHPFRSRTPSDAS